ncbi:flavin-containing monooxygenase [Cryptosporangium minutisporangium]|uniref:NAD(P)/FAD-dependent oxidoreductase n=1 Tax=Cryptosporangium minutisporangium TaxID=113569 RepID=A0ABP6SSJ9_9ACTN
MSKEIETRYEAERRKRLRPDGKDQYRDLAGDLARFDHDPYAPADERAPVVVETEVAIVGAGFSGMMTAVNLIKQGIEDFYLVDKAGDFGGTWYWNRYPGCMCDVESYCYLPFLEETGYVPTERYAKAAEIFGYCQLLGRRFDLYRRALFGARVNEVTWDEAAQRWQLTTARGDRLSARFVALSGGFLHKAKLPGVPGIEDFRGTAFHTSRWDYRYTGGSNTEPMERLRNKRVGIVGTGATGIQVVPALARTAGELFVFQRTPSAVAARNNHPTDVEWFRSLPPGWQAERVRNFTEVVSGLKPERNLVDDEWTRLLWDHPHAARTPEQQEASLDHDVAVMQELRARVDQIVTDPDTAAKLKPWYAKMCKRLCYHDEYLQSFNRPNVHLVDTEGKGVERITEDSVVVAGVHYPVDCLIFASGFEVGTDPIHGMGFDPRGREGIRLSEHWAKGPRTLHGVLINKFPNLLLIGIAQSAATVNNTHFLGNAADHCARLIRTCRRTTIEATAQAEEDWLSVLYDTPALRFLADYYRKCTPGYITGEQAPHDASSARRLMYPGTVLDYAALVTEWLDAGDFAGTIRSPEETS